jgi:hypothetical protein
MAELSDAEIESARQRGLEAQRTEPRATRVRYDRRRKKVVVDLLNGTTFAFPPHLAQGLDTATEDELAQAQILGSGYGLRWDSLDVDISVPALLAGVFGTRRWMAEIAGRSKSDAKAAAARANGAKGGRPRKAS